MSNLEAVTTSKVATFTIKLTGRVSESGDWWEGELKDFAGKEVAGCTAVNLWAVWDMLGEALRHETEEV